MLGRSQKKLICYHALDSRGIGEGYVLTKQIAMEKKEWVIIRRKRSRKFKFYRE